MACSARGHPPESKQPQTDRGNATFPRHEAGFSSKAWKAAVSGEANYLSLSRQQRPRPELDEPVFETVGVPASLLDEQQVELGRVRRPNEVRPLFNADAWP